MRERNPRGRSDLAFWDGLLSALMFTFGFVCGAVAYAGIQFLLAAGSP